MYYACTNLPTPRTSFLFCFLPTRSWKTTCRHMSKADRLPWHLWTCHKTSYVRLVTRDGLNARRHATVSAQSDERISVYALAWEIGNITASFWIRRLTKITQTASLYDVLHSLTPSEASKALVTTMIRPRRNWALQLETTYFCKNWRINSLRKVVSSRTVSQSTRWRITVELTEVFLTLSPDL